MKTYVTDELPGNIQTFISEYSKVYKLALVDAVNHRLKYPDFSKSELRTVLQTAYQINARQAGAIITDAEYSGQTHLNFPQFHLGFWRGLGCRYLRWATSCAQVL